MLSGWMALVLVIVAPVTLILMIAYVTIGPTLLRRSAQSVDFTVSETKLHLMGKIKMFVPGYTAGAQDPPHMFVEHGRLFENGGILYALKYGRGIFGRYGAQLRVVGWSYHSDAELLRARSAYFAVLRKHLGWSRWRIWLFWPSFAEFILKGNRPDRLKRMDSPNERPPAIDDPLEANRLDLMLKAPQYLVGAAIDTVVGWKVTEHHGGLGATRKCLEAAAPGATAFYHLVEHDQAAADATGRVSIDARLKHGVPDDDGRAEINRLAEAIRQSLARHQRAEAADEDDH